MSLKLYLVETRGLGDCYVLAQDANEAYRLLRDDFDARNYGSPCHRELNCVRLIAEHGSDYPECGKRLLIAQARK